MAHYAFLDDQNIVTEVITGRNEGELGIDWEQWYGDFRGQLCKRTSYNTRHGIHREGGTPFRKNFAAKGFIYDPELDAFIEPRPYSSWVLNRDTGSYEPPIAYPVGLESHRRYDWDEETVSWVELPRPDGLTPVVEL